MGHEYSFIEIPPDQHGNVKLGKYRESVLRMRARLYGTGRDEEQAMKDIEANHYGMSFVVVTNTDEEVVGYSVLEPPMKYEKPHRYRLSEAYVRPEDRRRGIYKELLSLRIKMAIHAGATSVFLVPYSDESAQNVNQIPYLLTQGFHRIHRRGILDGALVKEL